MKKIHYDKMELEGFNFKTYIAVLEKIYITSSLSRKNMKCRII